MTRHARAVSILLVSLFASASFVACGGSGETGVSGNTPGGATGTAGATSMGGSTNPAAGSSSLAGNSNTNGGTTSNTGGTQGVGMGGRQNGGAPTPCSSSGQCSPPNPYCDSAANVCVECLGDPNCGDGDRPHCALDTHRCVECMSDGQCGGDTPYCSPGNECVECMADGNCGNGEICDTTRHTCVPTCNADADCDAGGGRPYCDMAKAVCVQCLADANCPDQDRPTCIEGVCAECAADADCGGGDPYCETTRYRCVECLVDANCDQGETCDQDFSCQG